MLESPFPGNEPEMEGRKLKSQLRFPLQYRWAKGQVGSSRAGGAPHGKQQGRPQEYSSQELARQGLLESSSKSPAHSSTHRTMTKSDFFLLLPTWVSISTVDSRNKMADDTELWPGG